MAPLESWKDTSACDPIIPLLVGLIAHEIDLEDVVPMCWYAKSRVLVDGS